MNLKNTLSLLSALLLVSALTSCLPPAMTKATSSADLTSGKTIVVAKVELIPRLKPKEQSFEWDDLGTGELVNVVSFMTDKKYRQLNRQPDITEYDNRWSLELNHTEYTVVENKPFYTLAGMILLSVEPLMRSLYLPAGFKIDIHSGDKAVYVGTIRYYRDEFSEITKVRIIDNYKAEEKKFYKKFGRNIKLKKRLISFK